MNPGTISLLLIVTLTVAIVGLVQLQRGYALQAEAAARTRLEQGERASGRARAAVDARLRRTRPGGWLDRRLLMAGLDTSPAEFLALVLAGMAVTYLVGGLFLGRGLAAIAAVGVAFAAYRFLEYRRAKQREMFVQQLPEMARVLSNASSAGLSLPRALEITVGELDEPAAGIMQRVIDELRLGQSVDRALENLGDRMPAREVGVLVSTLVIQQRAGGDTVRALRDMSDTLQARKDLRREVRTIMSGAISTGWVVGALGIGALILLNFLSPGVLREMSESGIGRVALVLGIGLFSIGFLMIRRITRIET